MYLTLRYIYIYIYISDLGMDLYYDFSDNLLNGWLV